jgi:RNA polymerase sigma-54 factor
MQTHFGVFKVRKLFTKSIENKEGENVSSDSIRNIIKELIDNEDKLFPLTDQEIENKLLEQGINVPEWKDGLKRYLEEAKTIEQ